eukprot:m.477963 g.477963  ORF g.477963 m.477963 type:complete len:178 (-) comp20995_c0_seq1:985-1518(-)
MGRARRSAPAPSRRSTPAPARAAPARASAPARAAPRSPAPASSSVPARAPVAHPPAPMAQQPAAMGAPQQPSMMKQIAANAASVAVGSVVAHTAMDAIRGSGSRDAPPPAEQANQDYNAPAHQEFGAPPQQQGQQNNPCAYELQQFMDCAQNHSNDLTLCQTFNDSLKQCKLNWGVN